MSNILPKKSWHVYNVKNIEKVKKDEEEAKIKQEIENAKRLQDERESRLQLLRQKAKGDSPVVNVITDEKIKDRKRERFDLFVQEDSEHLAKKTESQKSIEEREKLIKPMSFIDVKKSDPWYLKQAKNNELARQHPADDPMASFGKISTSEKDKNLPTSKFKKDDVKGLNDLKKERELREKREKEKASKLLKSFRR